MHLFFHVHTSRQGHPNGRPVVQARRVCQRPATLLHKCGRCRHIAPPFSPALLEGAIVADREGRRARRAQRLAEDLAEDGMEEIDTSEKDKVATIEEGHVEGDDDDDDDSTDDMDAELAAMLEDL